METYKSNFSGVESENQADAPKVTSRNRENILKQPIIEICENVIV